MTHFEVELMRPKHESLGRSTTARMKFIEIIPYLEDSKVGDGYYDYAPHIEWLEIEYPNQLHPDDMAIICWAIDHDRRIKLRLRDETSQRL